MGFVQDPVHLYIVWVERLLILQRTTGSESVAESYNPSSWTTSWNFSMCLPLTSWKMCRICACLVLNLLIFWWILLSFSSCSKLAHSQCKYELETREWNFGCLLKTFYIKCSENKAIHGFTKNLLVLVFHKEFLRIGILARRHLEEKHRLLGFTWLYFIGSNGNKYLDSFKNSNILPSWLSSLTALCLQWQHLPHLGFPVKTNRG